MPDLAAWHPQVVHFVVALGAVGLVARLVSLLPLPPRFGFLAPAAALLIVLAAGASVVAVQSGTDAHGPAERVPGARDAVVEHEEWGVRARDALIVVALLEIGALALGAPWAARGLRATSGVLAVVALGALCQAAGRGGAVVYAYAGGVGIRSGDSVDVRRLLVAALYHNAMGERAAGRGDAAFALFTQLAQAAPDAATEYLRIESLIQDRRDGRAALAALAAARPDERLAVRHGLLVVDALEAAGLADSARVRLEALAAEHARDRRVQARLERMRAGAP